MNNDVMGKVVLLAITTVAFVVTWLACQGFLSFIMWDNLFLIPLDQWQWYARTGLGFWVLAYICLSISILAE